MSPDDFLDDLDDDGTPRVSVWEYTETAPDWLAPVVACWSWGLNYDFGHPGNPWPLFLDLCGVAPQEFGETVSGAMDPDARRRFDWLGLGPEEAGLLADALTVWANRPGDVERWLLGLFAAQDN